MVAHAATLAMSAQVLNLIEQEPMLRANLVKFLASYPLAEFLDAE